MKEHHSLGAAAPGRVLRYVAEAGGVPLVPGDVCRLPPRSEGGGQAGGGDTEPGQVVGVPAGADVALVADRVGGLQGVAVAAHRTGDHAVQVVVVTGHPVDRDRAGVPGGAQVRVLLVEPEVGEVAGRDHRRRPAGSRTRKAYI